jgi:hypothetical protein
MLKVLGGRLARRPWRVLFPALLLLLFIYTLTGRKSHHGDAQPVHKAKTKSFFPPLEAKSANSIELDYCQNFPAHLLDEIQVVLKVSSSDSSATKAHLSTVTSCISNLLIVSDREDRLGDRRVIDILAELPKSYEVNNLDFQAYVDQKKAHIEGETVKESQRSFKLDRFKYLPMVDKAYTTKPKAKWFVFLESDVYFFWDTLFRLLSQLDSSSQHYLGEPHKGSDGRYFAYGGAGFVISQGLMKKLIPPKTSGALDIPRESRLSHRYEDWVKEEQRGDAVLSYAIQNATGVKLAALHPTFSSYQLKDIKTTRDRWCYPLLSLHQLKPEQMENLWKWERTRQYNTVSSALALLIDMRSTLTAPRNPSRTHHSSRTRIPSSPRAPRASGGITSPPPPSPTTAPPTAMPAPVAPSAPRTPTASSGRSRKLSAATPTSSSSAILWTARTAARASSCLAGTRARYEDSDLAPKETRANDYFTKGAMRQHG